MAARITFVLTLWLFLASFISAQVCAPGLPIVRNPKLTIIKPIKLYVTDGKGGTRYPLVEATKVPNFGFFQAAKLAKPGTAPLKVTLQNGQLFNDFGGVFAFNGQDKKNKQLYFAADDRATPELVQAADVCNDAGKLVTVIMFQNVLHNLIYQRFNLNGTSVKPGATLLKQGNVGQGTMKIDVEIEQH